MEVVLAIVIAAAVILGAVRLVFMGRKRGRERREVENMFAHEGRDNAWWDERQ